MPLSIHIGPRVPALVPSTDDYNELWHRCASAEAAMAEMRSELGSVRAELEASEAQMRALEVRQFMKCDSFLKFPMVLKDGGCGCRLMAHETAYMRAQYLPHAADASSLRVRSVCQARSYQQFEAFRSAQTQVSRLICLLLQ